MLKILRCALFALALLPAAAKAEPIKLRLALFTSDRSLLYRAAVKPFADAVNAEARGLMEIDVQFSGALGRDAAQQVQLVLDGTADIAFVVPGYTPDRFGDDAVIELPGQFLDAREATLVFSRLVEAKLLKGYEDFYVIGAFADEPESIHTRPPIASLSDLQGKKIRVNNSIEAAALEKLGMSPVLMPINQSSDAIVAGRIDGATMPPAMLFEFGIGRFATYHYLLGTSVPPLALLMNRRKFDSLPGPAQDIIRKYSGEWAATRFIEADEAANKQAIEQLTTDGRRKVITPTAADLNTAQAAFRSVRAEWTAKSGHDRDLVTAIDNELAKLRATR